jgi:acetyl-CoA carboxylase biotin carboxyl carrier protein
MDQIRELVRILEESQVTEIEVSRFGSRVRVAKALNPGPAAPAPVVTVSNHQPAGVAPAPAPPRTEDPTLPQPVPSSLPLPPVEQTPEERPRVVIKSPMVGTFYRAPAPDAPPYVDVGDIVKVGDVVCIIEAMKLMNEIESDRAGRVVKVLVENAQPVEFGQELFWVEPLS